MKSVSIFNLSVCFAAAMTAFSGCYQTPEIDSQPEQAPKIVVDAKSEYKVASASADPVIFSISSNTPWQIENDAEDWCTVSPGASATSSLTADITVTVEDNQESQPRTATLTVTADGVEEPVLVKIAQNAMSKLEISNVSGEIPQNGGDVTFTVLSDQDWKIVSSAAWLTFRPDHGTGSANAVTVTAHADATSNMRSATVRVENFDGDFRTLTITQSGSVTLKFGEYDETARTFGYQGETRTFHVEASMLWKVSCTDPDVVIKPNSGTGSGDIEVTVPYSKYISDKTYDITLESDDESISMEPQTLTIKQDSFGYTALGEGSAIEGNTLTSTGANALIRTNDKFKYGTFEWTFSNVNLDGGFFCIDNTTDGITLRIRFGGTGNSGENFLYGEGSLQIGDRKVFFGADSGYDNGYNAKSTFTPSITVNELRSLKLEILPDELDNPASGQNQTKRLSRKIWVNGDLVLDNSETRTVGANDGVGGDIWQAGSSHQGLEYQFGISGGATGSMTIESFKYTSND